MPLPSSLHWARQVKFYREAGKLAEERYDEIAAALKSSLADYQRPNGIMMDSSVEGDS